MKKIFKKLIVGLIIFGLILIQPLSTAKAQTVPEGMWFTPSFSDFTNKVSNGSPEEIFGERYTLAQVHWIVYSLLTMFTESQWSACVSGVTGTDVVAAITDCANNNLPKPTAYNSTPSLAQYGPVLGLAAGIDGIRNTKPASGIKYISEKFDIVPTAYAQSGTGFNSLSATQNLWGMVRNMTYALMVLVVIVLAFGIMLRVKLNPQTVITVQTAIPRVVIALIAITFSYAIAGLLIDLAYVVQGVVAALIVATPTPNGPLSQRTVVQFIEIMNQPTYGVLSIGALVVMVAAIPTAIAALLVGGLSIIPVAGTTAAIGGLLFLLLILGAFIVGLIRIFWLFILTYAKLLIAIVFGPLMILAGAVSPGWGGVTTWVKMIVSQLSVFVVASILIVIAHIFIWGSNFMGALSGIEALNPYLIRAGQASLGSVTVPTFGSGGILTPEVLGFFTGLIILLAIPNLCSFIRDKISKPERLELGLGGAFGPSAAIGLGALGSYRAPERAILEAQIKDEAAAGTITPATRKAMRLAGLADQITGAVKKGAGVR